MSNFLGLDLNEVATKAISEKISTLEADLAAAREAMSDQFSAITTLNKKVSESKIALGLLNHLRNEFANIKHGPCDSGGYYDSKQKNQFLFIERVLLYLFNVKKETNGGWLSSRGDGSLAPYLAVNFYRNKAIVIDLLKVLMPNCEKEVSFIQAFKMPYDYPKEAVMRYVKAPQYNTNGAIFGVSNFWIEAGAAEKNMPHNLIMQSPFILQDDVFAALIDTIKKKASNYHYLFALPKHNKDISTDQIVMMGEQLANIETSVLGWDVVNYFIIDNLKVFNHKTLDFLYSKIQYDNQFKTLHWEKFPNEYQMRFLKEKSLDVVLKIITNHSCAWTEDEKRTFLKEFTQ